MSTHPEQTRQEIFIGNEATAVVPDKLAGLLGVRLGRVAYDIDGNPLGGAYRPIFIDRAASGPYNKLMTGGSGRPKPTYPTTPRTRYCIVRFYEGKRPRETVRSGLSLENAQKHCQDPQTSSATATDPEGIARTAQHGPWFEMYREQIRREWGTFEASASRALLRCYSGCDSRMVYT